MRVSALQCCRPVTAALALCLCWGELIAHWILHIALHACSHAVRPRLVMKSLYGNQKSLSLGLARYLSSSQQINIIPWDLTGGEWPVLATWPRRHPWDGLVRNQAVPGTAPGTAQPIRSRLWEIWPMRGRPRALPDLTARLIICVADLERETRPALGPPVLGAISDAFLPNKHSPLC